MDTPTPLASAGGAFFVFDNSNFYDYNMLIY